MSNLFPVERKRKFVKIIAHALPFVYCIVTALYAFFVEIFVLLICKQCLLCLSFYVFFIIDFNDRNKKFVDEIEICLDLILKL